MLHEPPSIEWGTKRIETTFDPKPETLTLYGQLAVLRDQQPSVYQSVMLGHRWLLGKMDNKDTLSKDTFDQVVATLTKLGIDRTTLVATPKAAVVAPKRVKAPPTVVVPEDTSLPRTVPPRVHSREPKVTLVVPLATPTPLPVDPEQEEDISLPHFDGAVVVPAAGDISVEAQIFFALAKHAKDPASRRAFGRMVRRVCPTTVGDLTVAMQEKGSFAGSGAYQATQALDGLLNGLAIWENQDLANMLEALKVNPMHLLQQFTKAAKA